MKKVLLGGLILVLLAAGFVVYNVDAYLSATHGSASGSPVKFTVPSGATLSGLGPRLQAAGVIGSSRDFKIYLRLHATPANLEQGDYTLRQRMPYGDLVSELSKGPVVVSEKVTIPEGETIQQTADHVQKATHISAADFVAAATTATVVPDNPAPQHPTLEGYLYPQTYFVDPRESAAELVRQMVAQFGAEASSLSWASPPNGVTAYEALVVASLIEKEAKAPSDGPMIAAVIYNRLKARMKLGIDATVYYAVGKPFGAPLTQGDLSFNSPYNTRAVVGLPPTPIASPQLSSMQAALQPASTNDIYYVLSSDCVHHSFFHNKAEFDAAAAHQPKC